MLFGLVIYQAIKILKTLDPQIFYAPIVRENKVWFFTGLQLLFVILLTWSESIVNMLFKMVGTNQDHTIATFNVVTTLADFMWISYFACRSLLDSSIAPTALQDRSKLQRLINRGNIIMFSSGVVFVLVFFMLGEILLDHFGSAYVTPGYPALIIIAFGYLFALAAGLASDVLEFAVDPKVLVKINIIGFIAACALGALLIYFYGLLGGVMTMVVIEIGSTLMYALLIRKFLHLKAFSVC